MTSSQILRDAMRLAGEQRIPEALALLDQGLGAASARGANDEIVRLARAAAVLAAQHGQPHAAAFYYEQAVGADPDDPYTQWALGDAYATIGDHARSQEHLDRFLELAGASADPEVQELLAAHLARTRHKP